MKGSNRGFTLLELLVSVGLLALLVLTLSMVFSQGLKALHTGYNRAEMYSSARTALEQMLREIPSAICDGTVGYPLFGYDVPNHQADGTGPELYFMGKVPGAGDSDVVELGYWWKRDPGANTGDLMRFYVNDEIKTTTIFELYTPALRPNYATGNSNVLAQNVTNLVIAYYYRSSLTGATPMTKVPTWDSTQNLVPNLDAGGNNKNPDGPPDAIEISLTVKDKLLKEQPKTLTVYIPLET